MVPESTPSIEIFFCYAHEDKPLREELDRHLAALKHSGLIRSWHDGEIVPGDPWEETIKGRLNRAQIILLLISVSFLNSDYSYRVEMQRAFERHEAGMARVIPILLRPVYLKGTPLSMFQMLPTGAKPITLWPDRDDAFTDVAKGIECAVNKLRAKKYPDSRFFADENSAEHHTPRGKKNRDQQKPKMDNTRRDVLIGAMGVVTVAGVGSGIIFLTHRDPPKTPHTGPLITHRDPPKTLQTGSLLYTYTGHPGYLSAVAWSSDGQRIASGGTDKTIQVWDATNGGNASTYNGHTDWVEEVVWSPDRRYIASASKDKTVRVWDTTSGGNTFVYRGHIGLVWDVAWSPDGKRIASSAGGTFDGTVLDATVQVWDAPNGGNVYTYRGHPFWSYVYTVVWSPNGQFIASGSNDGTVLVWNATNGDNVSTYKKQPYILGGVVA